MQAKKIKIIVAPDSFKGTMSSIEVGDIISNALKSVSSDVEIIKLAIADGGEGTIDSFMQNIGGKKINIAVAGPNFNKVECYYLQISNTEAVIELAQCAGLTLANPRNPCTTTTFGVGEIILHAINNGVKHITIALGGSATNDCGCGIAAALGAEFYNKNGKIFVPVGQTLKDVVSINLNPLREKLKEVKITAMCDVKNYLYGYEGAAYTFGRQKGANDEQIKFLDAGLRNIAAVVNKNTGIDIAHIEGGGAAGGTGAAIAAFLNGSIISGIETVLDACNFDNLLDDTDYVITGEGNFDETSLMGKVVGGIAARTNKKNIPLIVIAGKIKLLKSEYTKYVFTAYQTSLPYQSMEDIRRTCRQNLESTARHCIRNILTKN